MSNEKGPSWSIKTISLRDKLDKVLGRFFLDPALLHLVPSVHEATVREGYKSDRERVARYLPQDLDGARVPKRMLLRNTISQANVDESSLVAHVEQSSYLRLRESPELFVLHSLLHEIAHVWGIHDHTEADRWALSRLEEIDE